MFLFLVLVFLKCSLSLIMLVLKPSFEVFILYPSPNHLCSPTRANENIEPNESLAYFQNKFSKNICFAIHTKHLLCLCGTVFGKLDENEFLFLVNWKLTTSLKLTRKCNEVCFIEALAVEECYEGLYGGIRCRNVSVWATQARGFRIPPSQRQFPTRTTTLLHQTLDRFSHENIKNVLQNKLVRNHQTEQLWVAY